MFEHIIHSNTGWFHFAMSIIALITGTMVVLKVKGTTIHKRTGYIYVVAMYLLNISSFFISNFNGFSLFHFFAIVSIISVSGGMLVMWLNIKQKLVWHFYYMSWSVVGLYCALWAEIGVRFVSNMKAFWWVVALATIITSLIGHLIITKQAKKLNFR